MQVDMLQRIYHQYNRYESALDDTLIGIESLSSGYLTHHILDQKTLSRCLKAVKDNICHATRAEEDPTVTQNIQCLQRGGRVALIQTK